MAAIEQHDVDRLADQVERLAHHALRGEVWDKAVAYCRQAGDKAVARSASREAVTCFEQALVALAHLPAGRERHEQAIDSAWACVMRSTPWATLPASPHVLREAEALARVLTTRAGWARLLPFCHRLFRHGDL